MTKARTLADNFAADINGITAGTGITGGGTSGTVTITNEMATTITAKGDLIVGTGNATYDNLAVGTNGHTLVADSSQSTGLKWAAASAPSYTWAAWTPASRTDFVVGNGTEVARYVQIGNVVFWFYKFTLGSTSSISGSPTVALPVATLANWEESINGVATFVGSSRHPGESLLVSSDRVQFRGWKSDGTWTQAADISASTPFSWTTGNAFYGSGSYEVA